MSRVGTHPSATSVFLPWSHFHKFNVEKMTFSLRTRAHHAEIESAILTSSARRVWFVLYRTELRSSIREVTSRSLSDRLSDDESIANRLAPMAASASRQLLKRVWQRERQRGNNEVLGSHSAILRILSRRSLPCAKMMKAFLRSFLSSSPVESDDAPAVDGTGRTESSISADCAFSKERQMVSQASPGAEPTRPSQARRASVR